mmetsp:Transcript_27328/g.40396  ORF Transcript_27328/g.40396 Transcript_27328/m.40396 type:complete len:986 (-) Transcript_27328:398-3355(-)
MKEKNTRKAAVFAAIVGIIFPYSLFSAYAAEDVSISCNNSTDATSSCFAKYYKISDQSNGLATSCASMGQTNDPVVGVSQSECQAACDSLPGCDTVNFRWSDPNFNGESSCYRKICGDFSSAVCTLFTNHKGRDVYTKACGAESLYPSHIETDNLNGLFAGVRCPDNDDADNTTASLNTCTRFTSTNNTDSQCDMCYEWSGTAPVAGNVRTCRLWEKGAGDGNYACRDYAPSAQELKQRSDYQKYLQKFWSEVGLCDLNYTAGSLCNFKQQDGQVCEVRDQPCQGDVVGLGGVAGVLSKGWKVTFATEQDTHVCTMCGRGTYGSCDDACSYRRNFFWSGFSLGQLEMDIAAHELKQLFDAFIGAKPEEDYYVPQVLELREPVVELLPDNHPMKTLNSKSIYSLIAVNKVSVTVRDQLRYIHVGLMNMEKNLGTEQVVPVVLSTTGTRVYETCTCKSCHRGQYQDSLGETSCKNCEDILPGSDTQDMGADGPQHCKCLESNDVFLSGDKSECTHCNFVRNGTSAAPKDSCTCGIDTYEVFVESGQQGVPENAAQPWVTCQSCPAHSSTFNGDLTRHEYGSSIASCYCKVGWYRSGNSCSKCPGMKTSNWDAQSSSDCYFTESAKLLAIILPIGLAVFVIVLAIIVNRYRTKIANLEKERIRAMKDKILVANQSVNYLAHPMVLITATNFLEHGKMIKYEDARSQHLTITIDTTEELKGFRRTNKMVFFSHQWLAYAEPDPRRLQYDAMAGAIRYFLEKDTIEITQLFIWLDYTCIPQTHRGLQQLSINSLPMYAGACDFFIIVAPESFHADTGADCNSKSYQDRSWCRAEQLSHGCRVGVDRMFITTGAEIKPVTWDWIKPSFHIFNGNLTCCTLGHKGFERCDKEFLITPLLGLYCELLALERNNKLAPRKKEVLDFMKENQDQVFPRTIKYITSSGKVETRECFGDILSLLTELDLSNAEVRSRLSINVDGSMHSKLRKRDEKV